VPKTRPTACISSSLRCNPFAVLVRSTMMKKNWQTRGIYIYITRGYWRGARKEERERDRGERETERVIGISFICFYFRQIIEIEFGSARWSDDVSSPIIYIFARPSRRFKGLSMRPCGIDAKLFDLFLHRFSVSRRVATESEARRARADLSNIITRRHVYTRIETRATERFEPRTWMDSCARLRNQRTAVWFTVILCI